MSGARCAASRPSRRRRRRPGEAEDRHALRLCRTRASARRVQRRSAASGTARWRFVLQGAPPAQRNAAMREVAQPAVGDDTSAEWRAGGAASSRAHVGGGSRAGPAAGLAAGAGAPSQHRGGGGGGGPARGECEARRGASRRERRTPPAAPPLLEGFRRCARAPAQPDRRCPSRGTPQLEGCERVAGVPVERARDLSRAAARDRRVLSSLDARPPGHRSPTSSPSARSAKSTRRLARRRGRGDPGCGVESAGREQDIAERPAGAGEHLVRAAGQSRSTAGCRGEGGRVATGTPATASASRAAIHSQHQHLAVEGPAGDAPVRDRGAGAPIRGARGAAAPRLGAGLDHRVGEIRDVDRRLAPGEESSEAGVAAEWVWTQPTRSARGDAAARRDRSRSASAGTAPAAEVASTSTQRKTPPGRGPREERIVGARGAPDAPPTHLGAPSGARAGVCPFRPAARSRPTLLVRSRLQYTPPSGRRRSMTRAAAAPPLLLLRSRSARRPRVHGFP